MRARALKERRERALRGSDLRLDELRDGDGEQVEPGLGREYTHQQRLARAGRSVEQHAGRHHTKTELRAPGWTKAATSRAATLGRHQRAQALEPSYGGDIGNVGQAPERKP